jgi:hypothetical protein
MENFRRVARPVVHAVLLGFLSLTLHLPAANAALVATDVVVRGQQAQEVHYRLTTVLAREDVKHALIARGASPDQVQARVDSLTGDELQQLSAKIDQLPAGGDAFDALVLIFLVLLLTDILGLTDVFPFVKKPARR